MAHLTSVVADERLARGAQPDDLIGSILASDAFTRHTPERQRAFLTDQIATMLSAGYISTGESIVWTLYLLARHPEAQQRARAEVTDRGRRRGAIRSTTLPRRGDQ